MDQDLKDFLEAQETFFESYFKERDRKTAREVLDIIQSEPDLEKAMQKVAFRFITP